ncbi:MAG: type II toxin-antitoxin system RelE/ParE family toxin [Oscillospiraceae bacterium]|nr:type II toxin-antitoxin system RelE/ParE family toxin [Oscillospiraceae bacterium]
MEDDKYAVILARRADNMLIAHIDFLAQVSPSAARNLYADFNKSMILLSKNPFRQPFADELDATGIPANTYRKKIFYNGYKALYIIENTTVYVDAIIDCRQENKNLY